MIQLDTSQLPKPIVAALMLRGADVPPIRWFEHPIRAAKTALDQLADHRKLFKHDSLKNEAMASAVHALLYLWNGWPAEATMYGQLAPDREQMFIEALRARQAGELDASKELFLRVDGHPIYAPLAEYSKRAIGLSTTPLLKRLRDVIAFGEQWEPFAFADVYEQARDGQLDPTGEQIVRNLLCREFELLFIHCYEEAVGLKLAEKKAEPTPARRPTPKRPQKRQQARREEADNRSQKADQPEKTGPKLKLKPVTKSQGVEVLCPKCQSVNSFPESGRGAKGKCRKCGSLFLIPQREAAADGVGK